MFAVISDQTEKYMLHKDGVQKIIKCRMLATCHDVRLSEFKKEERITKNS